MSSITQAEKRFLENILGMASGYVLDYTDATFGDFFQSYQIHFHGPKYQIHGTSKAKKMRAFWELEPDGVVADILAGMLDSYEANCIISETVANDALLQKCREAVARLNGIAPGANIDDKQSFLNQEFTLPNVDKLPIEPQFASIIEGRLSEARIVLSAGAYLSVIFLCGSVLEAALLGAAQMEPAKFNKSPTSPCGKDGKPKKFADWNLAQLIDTAYAVGILKQDVQKFSHALRDFRNYIHPYQQVVHGFTPDEHTAKLCFQTLKAALADLAGERLRNADITFSEPHRRL